MESSPIGLGIISLIMIVGFRLLVCPELFSIIVLLFPIVEFCVLFSILITLKDSNGSIIETFTYTSEIGANNNNKSLCKFPESTGNWQECIQTPGLVNQIEII